MFYKPVLFDEIQNCDADDKATHNFSKYSGLITGVKKDILHLVIYDMHKFIQYSHTLKEQWIKCRDVYIWKSKKNWVDVSWYIHKNL